MNRLFFAGYLATLVAMAVVCYERPSPGDFDRYIYEALVRQRSESWEKVYPRLRQSYPRVQESTVAGSAERMAQIEPFYAIKPLYIALIGAIQDSLNVSPQQAIRLISVASFLLLGLVLYCWTYEPVLCAIVMATQPITLLARFGTPDALSTVVIVAACLALKAKRTFLTVLLLLVSVYVRTDNVILVLLVLAWMASVERVLTPSVAIVLAAMAVGSVYFVNYWSGNYGWAVLFRYSFLAGTGQTLPGNLPTHVSAREYLGVLRAGCVEIATRFAPWLLLSVAAWRKSPERSKWMLVVVALAVSAHFVLFPSAEDRYYAWAYAIVAAVFMESLRQVGHQDIVTSTASS